MIMTNGFRSFFGSYAAGASSMRGAGRFVVHLRDMPSCGVVFALVFKYKHNPRNGVGEALILKTIPAGISFAAGLLIPSTS
ncbi:MAG: hypothetical protein ACLRMJ_08105 [Alistipes finegoldii]